MKLNSLLSKALQAKEQAQQQSKIDNKLVSLVQGKEFYCLWSRITDCNNENRKCFNHVIGLPKNKHGGTNELFDYQKQLFDTLQSRKMVAVLKASGLGITEFCIRYISWLCLKDDKLKGTDIVIVTGPRLDLSITIIDRIKKLYLNYIKSFDTKQTTVILNGVTIRAYPSDHLDDARGIPRVSFIYVDEAAFFSFKEQMNLRDVIERYIIKSNPWIVLTSTPNKPEDIMDQIIHEKDSLYKVLLFPYTVGVGKMWTPAEIEIQKQSPSFEREYNLKFMGGIGNIFQLSDIDRATVEPYQLNSTLASTKILSIDCAFGSSSLGIVLVEWKDNKFNVLYENEISRPTFTQSIELVQQLMVKYTGIRKVLIDGSSPGFIAELKARNMDSYTNYHKMKPEQQDKLLHTSIPLVVAVNWSRHRKTMLSQAYTALSKGMFRIHRDSFPKLITALRTATSTPADTDYDKSKTSYSDVLDSFLQLSLLLE